MQPTKKQNVINTFEKHLFTILPLYNGSGEFFSDNKVIKYAHGHIEKLHGDRGFAIDKYDNMWLLGNDDRLSKRVCIAHTDSVVSTKDPLRREQRILYNDELDVIYNASRFRPMGGDDKVGVAIALTIADHYPQFSILLTADEEVGCIGSGNYDGPVFDFGVQCDRKGCNDLVVEICGGEIAHQETITTALKLLPHRKSVEGLITDIGELVHSKKVLCGFNMSCGYYEPHSRDEYIIYSQALMALFDAITLLQLMPEYHLSDASATYNRKVSGWISHIPDYDDYPLSNDEGTYYDGKVYRSFDEWYRDTQASKDRQDKKNKNDVVVVPLQHSISTSTATNGPILPEEEEEDDEGDYPWIELVKKEHSGPKIECDTCQADIIDGDAYYVMSKDYTVCLECGNTLSPQELASYLSYTALQKKTNNTTALIPELANEHDN